MYLLFSLLSTSLVDIHPNITYINSHNKNGWVCNKHEFNMYNNITTGVPGWLSRLSVWLLVLARVMISWFLGLSLTLGSVLLVRSLLRILSLCLCLCLCLSLSLSLSPLPCSLSHSLSLSLSPKNKISKLKKNYIITKMWNSV